MKIRQENQIIENVSRMQIQYLKNLYGYNENFFNNREELTTYGVRSQRRKKSGCIIKAKHKRFAGEEKYLVHFVNLSLARSWELYICP